MPDRELKERIRHEAYILWLEDGCPHGRDDVHWRQAEQLIHSLDAQRAEAAAAGVTRRDQLG